MLYIIGLGLNEEGISLEGIKALRKCSRIYLEGYTINFPYGIKDLEKVIGKKVVELERSGVESDNLIKEAKNKDIALLVYGSPLFATTHISLVIDAEKAKVKTKIIYSASVFDAVAETGLQLYKFGKISSMPKQEADFMKYAKENKTIGAHSLILVDIGLGFKDALDRLKDKAKEKITVCSSLGTEKSKIFYGKITDLKEKEVEEPFCFIIPGELHFLEKEALERFE